MTTPTILLTGGTGKTARRIAPRLRAAGAGVRTAARSGADVYFDWYDESTHEPALDGVDAVYLVPPAVRLDFVPAVSAFIDRAVRHGVGHVTYLSARGVEHAPPETPLRAIELDLEARGDVTSSVLRPGWFLQDFSEYIFAQAIIDEGAIKAPTNDSAEAFIHVEDIAEVAAATLLEPAAHAGEAFELTGSEALAMAQIADGLSGLLGTRIVHEDVDPAAWVELLVADGMPADYAQMLGFVMAEFRAGHGAPTTDAVERVTGHAPRTFADYLSDPVTREALAPARV